MHPYAIDRMVHERQDELARLARADRGTRTARRARARARPVRPGRATGAWFGALAARIGRRPVPTPRLDPCPGP